MKFIILAPIIWKEIWEQRIYIKLARDIIQVFYLVKCSILCVSLNQRTKANIKEKKEKEKISPIFRGGKIYLLHTTDKFFFWILKAIGPFSFQLENTCRNYSYSTPYQKLGLVFILPMNIANWTVSYIYVRQNGSEMNPSLVIMVFKACVHCMGSWEECVVSNVNTYIEAISRNDKRSRNYKPVLGIPLAISLPLFRLSSSWMIKQM